MTWQPEPEPLLAPPVTPGDRMPLRPDHNYDFMLTDRQVDERARTQPHGHVRPREDGRFAKCGGPRACGTCRREAEILAWDAGAE